MAKARRKYLGPDGKRLPGVTTVIGDNLGWSKNALIGWAHKLGREGRSMRERDEAADLGSATHEAAGELLGGEKFDEQYEHLREKVWANGQRIAELVRSRYEVLGIEVALTGPDFGGTIDLILGAPDGSIIVGDIKTGKEVYDEVAIQLGGYDLLREHDGKAPFARGVIIHAPAGESASIIEVTRAQLDAGRAAFVHLLALHQLKAACKLGDSDE